MGRIGKACQRVDWEKHYEIEADLEALCRAEAVRKSPERLKAAQALAKKKLEENKNRRDQFQKMVDLGEGKNP
ncbi:MAG: hypothetical protein ACYC9I_08440 [Desulfuromonadales bacterium]